LEAFRIADDVLRQGVQGIAEIITMHGVINVDFADVKTIMKDTGSALMGIGLGKGENRAVEAAKSAICSPLLEISIDGARGILFTVTGGPNLTMSEVEEAAKIITSSAADDVKVIFGAIIDEAMGDSVKVTVIATGFEDRRVKPFVNNSAEDEISANLFSAAKFSPSPFLRRAQKEETEEEKKFKQFTQNPPARASSFPNFSFGRSARTAAPAPNPNLAPPAPIGSDDDLEIPAFLRKKMGS
jgi:cell division protein FtsZ